MNEKRVKFTALYHRRGISIASACTLVYDSNKVQSKCRMWETLPALFTKSCSLPGGSSPPKSSSTTFENLRIDGTEHKSSSKAWHVAPRPCASISAWTSHKRSSERLARMTWKPCCASAVAVALPIPEEACKSTTSNKNNYTSDSNHIIKGGSYL